MIEMLDDLGRRILNKRTRKMWNLLVEKEHCHTKCLILSLCWPQSCSLVLLNIVEDYVCFLEIISSSFINFRAIKSFYSR